MTDAARRGFSVRVFLPGGDPDGLKVIEKSNWTGTGLVVPRPLFSESKERSELDRAGVYLLVGPGEAGDLPKVYIGEGDPTRPRLESHVRSKEFWTHAVVFTSKDGNLNKAHVQRLESRLVQLATSAKRCDLDNGNSPNPPSLSEADTAEVDGFLDDLLLCLPTLGFGFFEVGGQQRPRGREFTLSGRGIEARGIETSNGFLVRAGSTACKTTTASLGGNVAVLRARLVERGVLVDAGGMFRMDEDFQFTSPSLASSTLLGRSDNGRTSWKTADGRTLKEIQEAALDS